MFRNASSNWVPNRIDFGIPFQIDVWPWPTQLRNSAMSWRGCKGTLPPELWAAQLFFRSQFPMFYIASGCTSLEPFGDSGRREITPSNPLMLSACDLRSLASISAFIHLYTIE